MIRYNGKTMTFTGKDYKLVAKYAKEHKLLFKEVVYLAIMNGIVARESNKKKAK